VLEDFHEIELYFLTYPERKQAFLDHLGVGHVQKKYVDLLVEYDCLKNHLDLLTSFPDVKSDVLFSEVLLQNLELKKRILEYEQQA